MYIISIKSTYYVHYIKNDIYKAKYRTTQKLIKLIKYVFLSEISCSHLFIR